MRTAKRPKYAATSERLVLARQSAGFTSEAAALQLGVPHLSYQRQETGRCQVKPAELRRYAEGFVVPFAWLSAGLGGVSSTSRPRRNPCCSALRMVIMGAKESAAGNRHLAFRAGYREML